MPNIIDGDFTIKEVLRFTRDGILTTQAGVVNIGKRFEYAKRDKVKFIKVKSIRFYDPDRPKSPYVLYEIISQSTPNYSPYIRKGHKTQRRIKHDYEIVLQMDQLSINTKAWRGRLGKLRKIRKPDQKNVQQVYRTTRKDLKKKAVKKFENKKDQNKYIKKEIRKIKKNNYVSVGDWQSQVLGVNQDFIYRCAFAWKVHGHLYKLGGYQENRLSSLNPKNIMFFPKHFITIIDVLLQKGVLHDE